MQAQFCRSQGHTCDLIRLLLLRIHVLLWFRIYAPPCSTKRETRLLWNVPTPLQPSFLPPWSYFW